MRKAKASNPLNILLVEDDDGDAMAIRRAFKTMKIANQIVRAVDGIDAMDMLKGTNSKARISPPYILLVDINMPRMNGIQFIEAVRADEDLQRSIVFVLTTSKRDADKVAAYNLNVAGYIVKETAGQDFLSLTSLVESYWHIVEMPSSVE